MRRVYAVVLALVFGIFAVRAEDADRREKALDAIMKALETSVKEGDPSWWSEKASPTLKATATYTGLGADAATLLTLDSADTLWPSWADWNKRFGQFGLAVAAYTCLEHAAQGRYDKAVLVGAKTYIVRWLSKVSKAGSIYAAGIGMIDFALDYLGNAAQAQIADDYWRIYCRYHMNERPKTSDWTAIIEKHGYEGLCNTLDEFWDDPMSAGIRGWYTFTEIDPDYEDHFRNRYIAEKLAKALKSWAEERETDAYVQARAAMREMLAALDEAKIVFTGHVQERYTGATPSSHIVELRLDRNGKPIASSKIRARRFKLSFPLSALYRSGKMQTSVHLVIRPKDGVEGTTEKMSLDLKQQGKHIRRNAKDNVLYYSLRRRFVVETMLTVKIDVNETVRALTVIRTQQTPMSDGGITNINLDQRVASGAAEDGVVTVKIPPGRYLLKAGEHIIGPLAIDGSKKVEFKPAPVQAAEPEADPPLPDPEKYEEILKAAIAKLEARKGELRDIAEDFWEAFGTYWTEANQQLTANERACAALAQKKQELGKDKTISAAERKARQKRLDEKRDALLKQRQEVKKQLRKLSGDYAQRIWNMQHEVRSEAQKKATELNALARDLRREWSQVRQKLEESEAAIEDTAAIMARGSWQSRDAAELEKGAKSTAEKAEAVPVAQMQATLKIAKEKMQTVLDEDERLKEFSGVDAGIGAYSSKTVEEIDARLQLAVDEKLVQTAKKQQERLQKKLEKRRAARRRAEELLARIMEKAKALPEIDAPQWEGKHEELQQRFDEELKALRTTPAQPDQWRTLLEEIDGWLDTHKDVCGDLLPADRKVDTAFSDYLSTFRKINPAAFRRYLPRSWGMSISKIAGAKLRARSQAVRPMIRLQEEVSRYVGLGQSNEARVAAIKALKQDLGKQLEATPNSPAECVQQLTEARQILDRLPLQFREEADAQWRKTRRDFVKTGDVRRYLEASGKSYIVVSQVDGEDYDKVVFWPDQLTAKQKEKKWIKLSLEIVGAEASYLASVFSSHNGRNWRELNRTADKFTLSLALRGHYDGFHLQADHPEGPVMSLPAIIPFVVLPELDAD